MKNLFIIFLILTTLVFAKDDQEYQGYIDKTHKLLSGWVYDTSNSLDLLFSREDVSSVGSNNSYLDLSFDSFFEENRATKYRLNAKLRLKLPRTQKRWDLIFEDYKDTLSIDTQNSSNAQDAIKNNSYILGVQSSFLKSSLADFKVGTGIHFSGILPDFYLSLYLNRQFLRNGYLFDVENQLRYFVRKRFDDICSATLSKALSENFRIMLYNGYHYSEDKNNLNEVTNSLILQQYIGRKSALEYHLSMYSLSDRDREFKSDYYLIGATYKRYFYKNFAYYKIDPGIIFRRENNFNSSLRFVLQVGLFFGKTSPKSYKKF